MKKAIAIIESSMYTRPKEAFMAEWRCGSGARASIKSQQMVFILEIIEVSLDEDGNICGYADDPMVYETYGYADYTAEQMNE